MPPKRVRGKSLTKWMKDLHTENVRARKSLAYLSPYSICLLCCFNLWPPTLSQKEGKGFCSALHVDLLIIRSNFCTSRFLKIAPPPKLASPKEIWKHVQKLLPVKDLWKYCDQT